MGFFYLFNRELERRCAPVSGLPQVNYRGPALPFVLLLPLVLIRPVTMPTTILLVYTVFAAANLGAGAMAGDETCRDAFALSPLVALLVKWGVAALPLALEAAWVWTLVGWVAGGHTLFYLLYAEGLILWYSLLGVFCAVSSPSLPRALVATYASLALVLLGAPLLLVSLPHTSAAVGTALGALAVIHPLGPLTASFPNVAMLPACCAVLGMGAAWMAAESTRQLHRWMDAGAQIAHPPALVPATFSARFLLRYVLVPLLPRRFFYRHRCFGPA